MIERTIIDRFKKIIWNANNQGLAAIAYLPHVQTVDEVIIYSTTDFAFYLSGTRLLTFLKESFELATKAELTIAPYISDAGHWFSITWPTGKLLVKVRPLQSLETAVRWGVAGDLSQAKLQHVDRQLVLLSELQHSEVLWENQDELSRLQKTLTPMPPKLKQGLWQFWYHEFQSTTQLLLSAFTRSTITGGIQLGERLVSSAVTLLLLAHEQYGTGTTISKSELATLVPETQVDTTITAFYQALLTAQVTALQETIATFTQQIEQVQF